MSDLELKLQTIPLNPGVYLYKNKEDKVIYVGKAKHLRNRVKSYFVDSNQHSQKTRTLRSQISDVEFFITDTEREALILENNLIKKYWPHFNVRLKDDKTYPYIRITNEPFPQVIMTRNIVKDGSKYYGPYTTAYDIKNALTTLKKFFQIRSCTFYMDETSIRLGKHNLCLDYQIKRCGGPCEAMQPREEYLNIIALVEKFLQGKASELISDLKHEMAIFSQKLMYEKAAVYRDTVLAIETFFNRHQKMEKVDGAAQDFIAIAQDDTDVCVLVMKIREGKLLSKQHTLMENKAFDDNESIFVRFIVHHYDELQQVPDEIYVAESSSSDRVLHQQFLRDLTQSNVKLVVPKIGDKIKLVHLARINAKQILDELKLKQLKKDFTPKALKSLKRDLRLTVIPKRIECFDNSNIQGSDPVASMVVFVDGKPKKSEYRKFKIKTVAEGKPDDFASMYEVVFRRYKRLKDEKKPFPELIMVDGGKGQLSSAVQALKDLGVFPHPIIGLAKRLEEVFIPESSDPQNIPKTSSANKLLQQLRNEAHRFAITFHREKRAKRTLKSELDGIAGVGPKRRLQLLNHFGSVKKIKDASLEELKKISGFPAPLAETVFRFFQQL